MHYRTQLAAAAALALAPADDAGAASAVAAADTYRTLKIGGSSIGGEYEFQVKVPYSEGHTINAAEASTLNQTYAENVRNNLAGKIRAAREQAEKDNVEFSIDSPVGEDGTTLRQQLQAYADEYEFGVRAVRSSEPVDPVQREARSIARDMLAEAFRQGGVKKKDVDEDTYEAALNELAQTDDVQAEAKRRVKSREKIGAGALDIKALLGKGSAESEEAATSEQEAEVVEG